MAVSADDFKAALSCWPSGVTVVTTSDNGEHRAMTVSAFSSVSLEPPLVLVSINNESRAIGNINHNQTFCISILAGDQAEVSRACASRSRDGMTGIPFALGANGCPLIDGAVVHLECELHTMIGAGDHQLVVGLVTRAANTKDAPLLYWSRQYGEFTPTQKPGT